MILLNILQDKADHFNFRDFEEGLRKLNFSKSLGRSGQEALFNMIDANKNGKVRFSEFAMFVSGSRYTDARDKLRMLITRAARDWDGGRGEEGVPKDRHKGRWLHNCSRFHVRQCVKLGMDRSPSVRHRI